MTMPNKYLYRAHISEAKFRLLLKCFAVDETASKTSFLCSVNVRTVESIFTLLKETEYRFNHRQDNIYKIVLTELRKRPLRK